MVNECFSKAYPPFYPKPSTFYNSHSLSIMQKSLAPSREGTALSPPTPGSCSTSSTITAARGTLSTIGSFNPFLPEHFLSTGFLGSLKLFHFHVSDLAFFCRSIKSQKKLSKPPKPPFSQAFTPEKRSVPPMSLQQLFFLQYLRRRKISGCCYKILPVILSPIQTHFAVTKIT